MVYVSIWWCRSVSQIFFVNKTNCFDYFTKRSQKGKGTMRMGICMIFGNLVKKTVEPNLKQKIIFLTSFLKAAKQELLWIHIIKAKVNPNYQIISIILTPTHEKLQEKMLSSCSCKTVAKTKIAKSWCYWTPTSQRENAIRIAIPEKCLVREGVKKIFPALTELSFDFYFWKVGIKNALQSF